KGRRQRASVVRQEIVPAPAPLDARANRQVETEMGIGEEKDASPRSHSWKAGCHSRLEQLFGLNGPYHRVDVQPYDLRERQRDRQGDDRADRDTIEDAIPRHPRPRDEDGDEQRQGDHELTEKQAEEYGAAEVVVVSTLESQAAALAALPQHAEGLENLPLAAVRTAQAERTTQ